jgi:hypothetical protein
MMYVILFIVALAGLILLFRLLGAWMLRINDIISIQREMLQELRRLNNSQD